MVAGHVVEHGAVTHEIDADILGIVNVGPKAPRILGGGAELPSLVRNTEGLSRLAEAVGSTDDVTFTDKVDEGGLIVAVAVLTAVGEVGGQIELLHRNHIPGNGEGDLGIHDLVVVGDHRRRRRAEADGEVVFTRKLGTVAAIGQLEEVVMVEVGVHIIVHGELHSGLDRDAVFAIEEHGGPIVPCDRLQVEVGGIQGYGRIIIDEVHGSLDHGEGIAVGPTGHVAAIGHGVAKPEGNGLADIVGDVGVEFVFVGRVPVIIVNGPLHRVKLDLVTFETGGDQLDGDLLGHILHEVIVLAAGMNHDGLGVEPVLELGELEGGMHLLNAVGPGVSQVERTHIVDDETGVVQHFDAVVVTTAGIGALDDVVGLGQDGPGVIDAELGGCGLVGVEVTVHTLDGEAGDLLGAVVVQHAHVGHDLDATTVDTHGARELIHVVVGILDPLGLFLGTHVLDSIDVIREVDVVADQFGEVGHGLFFVIVGISLPAVEGEFGGGIAHALHAELQAGGNVVQLVEVRGLDVVTGEHNERHRGRLGADIHGSVGDGSLLDGDANGILVVEEAVAVLCKTGLETVHLAAEVLILQGIGAGGAELIKVMLALGVLVVPTHIVIDSAPIGDGSRRSGGLVGVDVGLEPEAHSVAVGQAGEGVVGDAVGEVDGIDDEGGGVGLVGLIHINVDSAHDDVAGFHVGTGQHGPHAVVAGLQIQTAGQFGTVLGAVVIPPLQLSVGIRIDGHGLIEIQIIVAPSTGELRGTIRFVDH